MAAKNKAKDIQAELNGIMCMCMAEKLNITDRAVSKWKTGKSMHDSSIMLELCEILGITVNELLSGEEIGMDSYEKRHMRI